MNKKNEAKINIGCWYGKPIEELDKPQLLECIEDLLKRYQEKSEALSRLIKLSDGLILLKARI